MSEMFENTSTDFVCSRPRVNQDLRTWRTTELRRIRRGINPKFLNCIHWRQGVRSTENTQTRQGTGTGLAQSGSRCDTDVGADTIHEKIVSIRPLTIRTELSLLCKS